MVPAGHRLPGAGRAEGDLTPGCAAALAAVLEALGRKAGPEDTRTGAQRRHDALEEACRRLIRAGMVPGRAGQPTQAFLHMTLAQLRGLPGASAAEAAWAAARVSQPGWVTGPEAEAAACDATVVPVVTGHVDWIALDRLADACLLAHGIGRHPGPGSQASPGAGAVPDDKAPLNPATRDRLRRTLLALAADALSGPEGLAARVRAALDGRPLNSVSLPLDVGTATETIPAHLRRAVTTSTRTVRSPVRPARQCARSPSPDFPGHGRADQLPNLGALCGFHHLTVIHRGLGSDAAQRRHHHGHQPGRQAHPA